MTISQLKKMEPWLFPDVNSLKFGSVSLRKLGLSCLDVMIKLMVVLLVMSRIISQGAHLMSICILKKMLKNFGIGLRMPAHVSL